MRVDLVIEESDCLLGLGNLLGRCHGADDKAAFRFPALRVSCLRCLRSSWAFHVRLLFASLWSRAHGPRGAHEAAHFATHRCKAARAGRAGLTGLYKTDDCPDPTPPHEAAPTLTGRPPTIFWPPPGPTPSCCPPEAEPDLNMSKMPAGWREEGGGRDGVEGARE